MEIVVVFLKLKQAICKDKWGIDQEKLKIKNTKKERFQIPLFQFLVRTVGLEPTRSPIRPSNVRVCQFRHPRIYKGLLRYQQNLLY